MASNQEKTSSRLWHKHLPQHLYEKSSNSWGLATFSGTTRGTMHMLLFPSLPSPGKLDRCLPMLWRASESCSPSLCQSSHSLPWEKPALPILHRCQPGKGSSPWRVWGHPDPVGQELPAPGPCPCESKVRKAQAKLHSLPTGYASCSLGDGPLFTIHKPLEKLGKVLTKTYYRFQEAMNQYNFQIVERRQLKCQPTTCLQTWLLTSPMIIKQWRLSKSRPNDFSSQAISAEPAAARRHQNHII